MYAIEVKTAPEGRADRLVPLWAQACLEASRAASDHPTSSPAPLAIVAAPEIAPRAAEQVLQFAATYAPNVAAGVVDLAGLRRFRGPGLGDLDAPPEHAPRRRRARRHETPSTSGALFSDLNQWLLKVLLAPELPEGLLTAPRDRYSSTSQLARAAGVSVMSASRLVQQLERDGYLDADAPHLTLVRRDDLLRRWAAAAELRPVREVRMRYLLAADPAADLRRVVRDERACLALFAAADALGLGFVDGVPPYVYVPRLDAPRSGGAPAAWKHLTPAAPGEAPDVIVRQAPAPQSVFRGAVRARALDTDDVPACDVLQVWLDVSAHPARGREQADLIRRRTLAPLFGEQTARG